MSRKSDRFISVSSGPITSHEKYSEVDQKDLIVNPLKNDSAQLSEYAKYNTVTVSSKSNKVTYTINVGMSAKGRVIQSAKDIINKRRKISKPTDEVA